MTTSRPKQNKQLVGGAVPAPRQHKKETKKMSKVKINPSVKEDLEKLVVACRAAKAATYLRARLKSFIEDNEMALREGVAFGDVTLKLKISKQLNIEEEA